MKRIFVIIAKSSCGKDTLYHALRNNKDLNLKTFILYYTRPMRVGEVNGETYRFVSNEEMDELVKDDKVIASEYYPTHYGGCTIAFLEDDQLEEDANYLGVMSLKFYEKAKEYFKNRDDVELVPIYIEVSARERIARALAREEKEENPNYREILRRFVADEDDFKKEVIDEIPVTNIFSNNGTFDDFLNEVTDMVARKINEDNKLSVAMLKKCLLAINNNSKHTSKIVSMIIGIFRENDAYEETLFDILSYCKEGKLLDCCDNDFDTLDDLVKHLHEDMYREYEDETLVLVKTVLENFAHDCPNASFGRDKVSYKEILEDKSLLNDMAEHYHSYNVDIYNSPADIVYSLVLHFLGDEN